MACKKFRIFPRTGAGTDGFPTVGTPVLLVPVGTDNKEHNIKSVALANEVNTASVEADDDVEETTVVKREKLTVEAFGINPEAIVALGLAVKDANGNLMFKNSNTTHVVLYNKGANQKGLKKDYWFYDSVAQPLDQKTITQLQGNSTDPITITFYNYPIKATGFADPIPHGEVFEGNTGYLADDHTIAAADLYKGTVAS